MSSLLLSLSWIWIPITVWAALAQTVRNAAQRTLTAEIGTLPATLVRFLYGLPLAAAWVLGTCVLGERPGLVPVFSASYAAWLALGAVMQVAATAFVLLAMQERNFILAVAYSKTELLQVALVSAVLLGEWPGPMALAAMAAAMVGVFHVRAVVFAGAAGQHADLRGEAVLERLGPHLLEGVLEHGADARVLEGPVHHVAHQRGDAGFFAQCLVEPFGRGAAHAGRLRPAGDGHQRRGVGR